MHLNGQDVRSIHVAHAHTDGDAMVWFVQANVLHMGDLYFNGLYPFIDVDAGGGINGMIDGVDRALALIDDRTVVVPGHGPLSNRAELIAYGKMLRDLRARVAALKRSEEHTSELQSLMRKSYAVFCLKKKQSRHEDEVMRYDENKYVK